MAIDTLFVYCGVYGDAKDAWRTTSSSRSFTPTPS